MQLCSDGHAEICYEEQFCPACEVIAERDEFEEEFKALLPQHEQALLKIEELTMELNRALANANG